MGKINQLSLAVYRVLITRHIQNRASNECLDFLTSEPVQQFSCFLNKFLHNIKPNDSILGD